MSIISNGNAPVVNRSVTIDAASGPLAVGTLDIDTGELDVITPPDEAAAMERVFALLRHHGWPVGVEVLPLVRGGVDVAVVHELQSEVPDSVSRGVEPQRSFTMVVCTRNRPEQLARSLPALVDLLDDDRELIVVDNAPRDDRTAAVVAKYGDAVRYIVEPIPGLARARNCGLRAANSKFVVFTDDDVVPDAAWLEVLGATFAAHPGAVCVSGSVMPMSLTTSAELYFQEFGGYQRTFEEQDFHLALDPPPSKLFPFHPRLVGTGANMAFRTEALASLGGFDEALGAGTPSRGGEDIDIAVRVLMAGLLVVRQPSAVIWHGSHRDESALLQQLEDYGCGLSAAFSKFMHEPKFAPAVLRRVPAGLYALLSPNSQKNDKRSVDYPNELKRAEFRGLRRGPLAYRSSRRLARRLDREQLT
ncbi:MAG: glycosyltransferase [Ilumatobacter sp.]|nr:glycosyltransferase [Ilumatobacter sp.]